MKLPKFISALLILLAFNAWAAVDINTASVADLDSIKGIGPGTSAKILEQRKSGKFKDWPDVIQRVPGIGEKRAAKLSTEGLTVNGTAFNGATEAAKPAPAKSNNPVAKTTPAAPASAPAK